MIYIKTSIILKKNMIFSGYDKQHFCFDKTNNKILGKFKDEMNGKIIKSFCALKSKMYSFEVENDDKQHMKAKGVPTSALKKQVNYNDYVNTLNTNDTKKVEYSCIRSRNHTIYTMDLTKIGLSSFDNKRWYYSPIDSYAYGNYRIKQLENKS